MKVRTPKIKVTKGDGADDYAAYVTLPGHPRPLRAEQFEKTVRLVDLIGAYSGPEIILDFAKENRLVGIEILSEE